MESAWLGRVIDARYRVERLLGEGGMGAVFLAEHVKLQKKVGLKIILPQFAGNGEVAERFAREAMASAKLEHPNIASALDYGTLPEGGAYLVMQYARGPSLRASLATPRSWEYACEVGAQIADALAAAHSAGIVHRDLKPENVVLERRDDGSELVRVLDFGIARVLDGSESSVSASKLTRVGTIIGTPGYMAPEQALGEPVDTRADLYALGVILWEITAGRELFTDTDATAIVTAQLTTEPPRLVEINPAVPAELDRVVASLLARDRKDRPQKAGEVRDALRRIGFAATMERASQASSSWSTAAVLAGTSPPSGSFVTDAQARRAESAHGPTLLGAPAPAQVGVQVRALARTVEALATQFAARRSPEENRRLALVVACALGALGLMLVALMVSLAGPATTQPPAVTAPSKPRSTAVGRPVAPLEAPRVTPGSAVEELPADASADFETLLHGEDRRERRDAAERLLARPEADLPRAVHLLAEMEDESRCADKRDILTAMVALGDARVLPALTRMADSPPRGCGFLGSQDCIRCLRGPLEDAIDALQ